MTSSLDLSTKPDFVTDPMEEDKDMEEDNSFLFDGDIMSSPHNLYPLGDYLNSSRCKLDNFVRAALQALDLDNDAREFLPSEIEHNAEFTKQDFCKLFYRVRQFENWQMTENSETLKVQLPTSIDEAHLENGCIRENCVFPDGTGDPAQKEPRKVGAMALIYLRNGEKRWYHRQNEEHRIGRATEHAEKLVINALKGWLQNYAGSAAGSDTERAKQPEESSAVSMSDKKHLNCLKKIVLYITYQPCHYSVTGADHLSCTSDIIDFYDKVLRSSQVRFIIKMPYLHKVHWKPKEGKGQALLMQIDNAQQGLKTLLDHDSIMVQAMDQLDWKLLQGLARE